MIYQKMYARLCGACSQAVDALEEGRPFAAEQILREALLACEEMYIRQPGPQPAEEEI